MIDLKLLVQSGVQFGHQTWRWCPKMAPYIWGKKNGIHLIDVSKTAHLLEKAANFLEQIAAEGKQILWVGSKPAAQAIIIEVGGRLSMPTVVHRWVGGTLTNYPQVRKSVTKYLHLQEALEKSDKDLYTKKEYGVMQKLVNRLDKNVGGIQTLRWPVGAVVVVDVKKEQSAVREARAAGIPVVALVDTNVDPSLVDYVIPSNDDIARAVKILLDYLAEAVKRGIKTAKENKKETVANAEQTINQLVEQSYAFHEGESTDADKQKKAPTPAPRSRKPFTQQRPQNRPAKKREE